MAKVKWPSKAGKYLKVPLFRDNLWVFYTREVYAQAMDSVGADRPKDMQYYGGVCSYVSNDLTGGTMIVIGIFECDARVVVHEVTHATQYILDSVGVDDDETFAYLNEELFDFVYKHMPKEAQNDSRTDTK